MDSFKVWVNGSPVCPNVFRKAVVGDRNVTEDLRRFGMSDAQIFGDADVTDDQKSALGNLKVANRSLYDFDIAEIAYWDQSFPAGQEIAVEHRYAPAVGKTWASVATDGSFDGLNASSSAGERLGLRRNEACLDDRTKRAILNRIDETAANRPESLYVNLHNVEYILSTGRNWKGPIGQFTLRVEKDKPEQIVSLCFPGKPSKVSPTVYEFREKDFVPQGRLVVDFYTVSRSVE